jgi:hypothetical protein
MANPEGQERLEAGLAEHGVRLTPAPNSTHGEFATQVWLAAPEVFAAKQSEVRLSRLSSFEYYGSKTPLDRGTTFARPDDPTLARITADLDEWFTQHNRGEENASVEVHLIGAEFWFFIRHGDTFARKPKVDRRKTEVLHFRPAVDDVAVYNPERDEIRIHAGTKGERQLYRRTFGLRLFGDDNFFCDRKAYTLEPLRILGPDALDTDGLGGISQIVLREIVVAWNNGFNEVFTHGADDLFAASKCGHSKQEAIPPTGRLVRASLDIYFGDSSKPRKVQIRPPNTLKIGRHCDARRVHEWLSKRGFRVSAKPLLPLANIPHVQPVAVS